MKNKKILTEINRTKEIMGLLNEQNPSLDVGDYHMWQPCGQSGVSVALYDSMLQTSLGNCFNASSQNIPGLVLACNQELVSAYGAGPVLQYPQTGGVVGQNIKNCWKYLGTETHQGIPNIATVNANTGGGGQPSQLNSCNQCGGPTPDLGWQCNDVAGGTGCVQVMCPQGVTNTPGGCYTNQLDCINGGINPGLSSNVPCGGTPLEFECTANGCVPWAGGQYNSLSSCNAVCSGGGGNYECTANGCVPDPNGQYPSLGQCQVLCPAGQPHTCNNGTCVADPLGNFPTLNDCQQNCSQTQTLNCSDGSPMYTPQQWNPNYSSFVFQADSKSVDAQNGGNGCNWICTKRDSLQSQAPFTPGSLGQDRKQCKLDYINDVYNNTPCQPNPQGSGCVYGGGATLSGQWTSLMTNRYNSTTGPGGCWGVSGNNNQSVCGRKAHFCPAPVGNNSNPSPMQQAKCDWLTDFINNQTNCGC